MANLLTNIFGSRNQRLLRTYSKQVRQANELAPEMASLSDDALQAKTDELKARLEAGASEVDLLPEAFAVAREAAERTIGLRPFDVQLVGGIALYEGKIAEMRTGEGKTLVATLPAYLTALSGKAVHIVTVNEYLAQRDADWMGPIYRFLGLSVGVIQSGQSPAEKREAYEADITYGTNNEFGFDYLRDNLAFRLEDRVQRDLSFAIVDEVDSILIDEARTPLIISGPTEESTELYLKINQLVPQLKRQAEDGRRNGEITAPKVQLLGKDGEELGTMSIDAALTHASEADTDLVEVDAKAKPAICRLVEPGDYTVDEKSKQVYLTEDGHQHAEQLFTRAGLLEAGASLYDPGHLRLMHHLTAALRAHALFKRDVEYVVKDGEIVIVDEFTGRTMPGRRWSDGLHQAIEAKEGVKVKEENQTIASITFQNYFRMYDKLAGMTGTADTEAFEFQQIYGLEVVVIPTHKEMIRDDAPDLVYLTQKDKFEAIIEDIKDCVDRKQPVLVGTTSIETSEYLSGLLDKERIKHQVLNAKQHAREAEIVVQAGRPGTVTIATNMAGRGTDIVLGGKLEAELATIPEDDEQAQETLRRKWKERHGQVVQAGGLHIVGTERHESRRIDNQLRGRSGRQGDPGSSRFYLSLEDNLMRIFGDPARTKALLSRVGMKEGEAIESKMLSRQIERAQRKVEAHNFDLRKQLLKYDDVANEQRKYIYGQRNELMATEEVADWVQNQRHEVVNALIDQYVPPRSVAELWDIPGLTQALQHEFAAQIGVQQWLDEDESLDEDGLRERIVAEVEKQYDEKVQAIGIPVMRHLEKAVMVQQLDSHWREHLAAMDYLRQGIGLRSFAQRNPEQEYKREAFEMFEAMLGQVKHDTVSLLSKVKVRSEEQVEAMEREQQQRVAPRMQFQHAAAASAVGAGSAVAAAPNRPAQPAPATPFVRQGRKVGRNEPCPCGSGKKYKHCHGRLD